MALLRIRIKSSEYACRGLLALLLSSGGVGSLQREVVGWFVCVLTLVPVLVGTYCVAAARTMWCVGCIWTLAVEAPLLCLVD